MVRCNVFDCAKINTCVLMQALQVMIFTKKQEDKNVHLGIYDCDLIFCSKIHNAQIVYHT